MDRKRERHDSDELEFPPIELQTKKVKDVDDDELVEKIKAIVNESFDKHITKLRDKNEENDRIYTYADAKNNVNNADNPMFTESFKNAVKTGFGLLSIVGAGYGAYRACLSFSKSNECNKSDDIKHEPQIVEKNEEKLEGKIFEEPPEKVKKSIVIKDNNRIILPPQ